MSDLQRVNIRVSPEVHQWFKARSERTGVPASALMFLALEQHVQQHDAVVNFSAMAPLLQQQQNQSQNK